MSAFVVGGLALLHLTPFATNDRLIASHWSLRDDKFVEHTLSHKGHENRFCVTKNMICHAILNLRDQMEVVTHNLGRQNHFVTRKLMQQSYLDAIYYVKCLTFVIKKFARRTWMTNSYVCRANCFCAWSFVAQMVFLLVWVCLETVDSDFHRWQTCIYVSG